MRLLIVADEVRIAELVQGALARAGFAVDAVGLCAEILIANVRPSMQDGVIRCGPDG